MLIDIIAGARPNFVKIAPVIQAIEAAMAAGHDLQYRLIHTGQHYDRKMSGDFFKDLDIPEPHHDMGVGSGTAAEQTGRMMQEYEKIIRQERPGLCIVVGDVTSTMACAITAKKMNNIPVAHIEAGIRSGDMTMPEEVNRVVTDAISDLFFTTSRTADEALLKAGVDPGRIFFVGNTMIDTLVKHLPKLRKPGLWDREGLSEGQYILMTLHRPSNVDDPGRLVDILDAVTNASRGQRIVFPVHPRTADVISKAGLRTSGLCLSEPLSYLEFIYLLKYARAVVTDSGGISEEATVLNVPCMTLRDTTERPETCDMGTNELLGTDIKNIAPAFDKLFDGKWKHGNIPENWDGHAAERIIKNVINVFTPVVGKLP